MAMAGAGMCGPVWRHSRRKFPRANSIRRCEAVGYIDIRRVGSAFGMADPGKQRTAEQAANQ